MLVKHLLQKFRRLEIQNLFWWHFNQFSSSGIPSRTGRPLPEPEAPKTADFNLFSLEDGFLDGIEEQVDTGHLMVAPYRHLGNFEKAPREIVIEAMEMVQLVLRILKKCYKPHGFNVGMNLGHSAGAGVADHFHLHIVPRWTGDANFMPIIGETKVFCEDLKTTYNRLKPFFAREEQKQEK